MGFLRKNIKLIIGIIIGAILAGGIVYATTSASQVTYTTNKNGEVQTVADALNDLYRNQKEINNNIKSNIINNITVSTLPTNDALKIIANVETTDSNKILGYHAYAIDDNQNIFSNMSTNNEITISGLSSNTRYNVYVLAYDVFNKYTQSESINVKTTTTLDKKTYSATKGSYPYILSKNNTSTLLNYGTCNIQLKKLYVKIQIGNSGAISASNVKAYVYGYTNNNWELIKDYSVTRNIKVSAATVANETIDLSDNEKVYTDFYISAKSSDNEIYANVEIQPTGILVE